MQPRAASRSVATPWLRLAVAGAIGWCLWGSVWLARAATQTADGGLPADLGRDELRCDAAGCAIGGCLLLQMERNPTHLLGHTRFIIEMADGRPRGFRLMGVTADSLLARLGLQNDDTVLSVSTYDLSSPENTLAAFNRLRSADSETLTFDRQGRTLTRVLRFDRRPLAAADCPLPPPPATASEGPPHSPTSPPALAPSDAETLRALAKDIRCVSNRCTLRSATMERLLSNTGLFMKSVRIVPVLKDGQPQGLKLLAIRPGSVFALLGLRNGDVAHTFNGLDLSTPDNALQAYAALRNAHEVKLGLERAGARMVLTYVIKK